jgi:hypothetical protein
MFLHFVEQERSEVSVTSPRAAGSYERPAKPVRCDNRRFDSFRGSSVKVFLLRPTGNRRRHIGLTLNVQTSRKMKRERSTTMKAKQTAYWIATILIGLETLAGGATDLARGRTMLMAGPFVVDIIGNLGYPAYILTILGVWKVLGSIVLFAPGLPRLKEWAYAGLIFELTGAAASFAAHGDPAQELIAPLVLASLALASWALRPPSRRLGVILSIGTSAARAY